MKLKVIHERWKCIGCEACVAVSPEFWEMSQDGKSDLKNASSKSVDEKVLQEREISKDKEECNREAADSCPVECIHLIKKCEQ